jgi:hypothetical protein
VKSALAILRRACAPWRLAVFTIGLLILGAGFYGWLRLPDSTRWYLGLQVVLGALLLLATGALVAGAVGSLACVPESASPKRIWRHAFMGVAVLIAMALLYWLSSWLESAGDRRIYIIASWLSYHLNHPVPIPPLHTAWEIVFWFVNLVLLPVLAIRLLAHWLRRSRKAAASETVGGVEGQIRRRNFFLFWMVAIVLALLFDWLPWELAWWAPHLHQGWAEILSAVLRLGTAGLAFAFGLLIQWSWYIGAESAPPPAAEPSSPG